MSKGRLVFHLSNEPFLGNRLELFRTDHLAWQLYAHGSDVNTVFELLPKSVLFLVGRAGFEPATNWLKANCSTS